MLAENRFDFYKDQSLPSLFSIEEKCPPVYDQGQQGSCSAHSACTGRTVLSGDSNLDFSRAMQYYNERIFEQTTDQDSGASMKDIGDALMKYGVCLNKDMPYNDEDYTTSPSSQNYKDALNYKIKSYNMITSGIDGIKKWIYYTKVGVNMGMSVYESMESDDVAKTGYVPLPNLKKEKCLGGHAVYIIGWKDNPVNKCIFSNLINKLKGKTSTKGWFLCRNSWSENWGYKGNFWLPYEYIEKGFATEFWGME